MQREDEPGENPLQAFSPVAVVAAVTLTNRSPCTGCWQGEISESARPTGYRGYGRIALVRWLERKISSWWMVDQIGREETRASGSIIFLVREL